MYFCPPHYFPSTAPTTVTHTSFTNQHFSNYATPMYKQIDPDQNTYVNAEYTVLGYQPENVTWDFHPEEDRCITVETSACLPTFSGW